MTVAEIPFREFVENPFLRNAMIGGLGVAMLCSVLSVFVVLRRMAFIGQGISHAAFGGAGLALLLGLYFSGLEPMLARDAIIAGFCVLSGLGIGFVARRARISEDTSIGIWLVAAMAGGVLLLNFRRRLSTAYTPSLEDLLFGQITAISSLDAAIIWALALVVVVATAATFKELAFFAFDEETAAVFGVRTALFYYALLAVLGLAVVAAMRSLGVILASALLILPGASARMLSNRIGRVAFLSVAIGLAGMAAGLVLASWSAFLSPGPVVVLTYCAMFVLSYTVNAARRSLRRRAGQ